MAWRSQRNKSEAGGTAAGEDLSLEQRTQQIGRELLAAMRQQRSGKAGVLSAKFWSDKLITGALEDERFKVELFRFVDVFPVLKTPAQIHQHLTEYLSQPGVKLPAGMSMAMLAGGLLKGTFARTIASQIEQMAGTFIAGRDLESALPIFEERWREGIAFSVDVLGEACVSHAEAAGYAERYLALIQKLPALVASWPANDLLEQNHFHTSPGSGGLERQGRVPRSNVSIKISAMDGHVSPVDAEGSLDRLERALAPLLQAAGAGNVLINFDMEQYSLKELTFRLFKRCCEKYDFPAGLALQAYLRSADEDARDLVSWARSRGRLVTVRLIKGAYWDYETIHAQMMGWPCPVWGVKHETDACFERVAGYLIREMPRESGVGGILPALGTHNVRSVAHGIAEWERTGLPKGALEFQALRGMADDLKHTLAEAGWRVREYMPIGEMIPGMAYLVRRLLENTSNQGWLHMGHGKNASDDELLASPHGFHATSDAHAQAPAQSTAAGERLAAPFQNEPPRDFSQAPVRAAFQDVLSQARVATIANDATEAATGQAIARAAAAFPAWRDTPAERRARTILQTADVLRQKRDLLSAEIILESHKTWAEADADVCEAIDFCEYYARQSMPLFTAQRLGQFTGEHNTLIHQPRGAAAVIAPWNFPLSICTGMTVAALVTGNSAIVKPAEQTPAIARRLCEALWAAGVPREVVQFLPGVGEVVGAALVRDPRIAIIAFTGSRDVGLQIIRTAAETPPQQLWVKRVICEMGGKNAMIVDESADLDEAVLAVRQSAFGYAGQKCSAGSRLILLESIHDAFISRLVEATRRLVPGDPRDPATDLGPVIDAEAAAKIQHYIDIGKQEATLIYPDTAAAAPLGDLENMMVPHIFANVLPTHRIARDEIFGPVLALLKARDFSQALELANDSVYKLTGGVFSRTPSHLDRARAEFRVGNLYLNRGITGALVGRQPFGGFGLSGVGSKAGGPHYLLQFTDPRAMTENTMRRGFAPTE